jgi:hypothetical protein
VGVGVSLGPGGRVSVGGTEVAVGGIAVSVGSGEDVRVTVGLAVAVCEAMGEGVGVGVADLVDVRLAVMLGKGVKVG